MSFYHGCKTLTRRFHLVLASFLQSEGLPFGTVLPEEQIERARTRFLHRGSGMAAM